MISRNLVKRLRCGSISTFQWAQAEKWSNRWYSFTYMVFHLYQLNLLLFSSCFPLSVQLRTCQVGNRESLISTSVSLSTVENNAENGQLDSKIICTSIRYSKLNCIWVFAKFKLSWLIRQNCLILLPNSVKIKIPLNISNF